MICLRCGHCCLTYSIVVVKDPEKGIIEDNYVVLDGTTRCPHLEGNKKGEYSCKIHHYKWFPETPCGQHAQFERGNTNCRLGEHLLKNVSL
jgi:hypothetical protein